MNAFFETEDKEDNTSEASIWVERYRPRSLNEYIGNEKIKATVSDWIDDNYIPHILLYGPAGTGKSTLADIITREIDCDDMYINASDEGGIDTIRDEVKRFASIVAMHDLRIVVLDEFDYMSKNAQAALRDMMEKFHESTRFILTCNYKEKILGPIGSRCQSFRVRPPSRRGVASHLAKILRKENVEFDKQDVARLVDKNHPDIRKVINTAQLNTRNGKLELNEATVAEANFEIKLVELLGSNKSRNSLFNEIRQLVQDSDVNQYERVFRHLYDNVDEYTDNVEDALIAISEAQHRDALVVDKEINFMHLIIELIETT